MKKAKAKKKKTKSTKKMGYKKSSKAMKMMK